MAEPTIICINLEHRTDRWAAMRRQFSRLGINARRLSGLVGTEDDPNPRGLSASRRGVIKSHLAALRWAEAERLPGLVILEDDALLANDFVPRLQTVVSATPADAPLCMLSAIFWWEVPLPRVSEQTVVHPDAATIPVPAGSHAYFIRREGYSALTAVLSTFEQGVDVSRRVAVERGLGYCLAIPFLASLAPEDSDIGDVAPEMTTTDDIRLRRACVERYFTPAVSDGDPRPPGNVASPPNRSS